ncbi:protein argonaute 2-like [Cryptomeria japonica]|uniref:protein argonaute 2-like n=1 Tax=Cryptomeria japonica TaxID=3369 RepID=UPI0027D9F276|nr:protein argonaute 2-like [Cryptomeria japonica]
MGELAKYDVEEAGGTDALLEVFFDPHIAGGHTVYQLDGVECSDRWCRPGEIILTLEEVDNDDQGGGGQGRRRSRGRSGGRIVVGGAVGHGRGGGGGGAGGGDEGGVVRVRGVVRGRGGGWRMGGVGLGGFLQAEDVVAMGVEEGSDSDGSEEESGDSSDEDTKYEVVGGGVGLMGLAGVVAKELEEEDVVPSDRCAPTYAARSRHGGSQRQRGIEGVVGSWRDAPRSSAGKGSSSSQLTGPGGGQVDPAL